MAEVSAEVMQQLEKAQAELARPLAVAGPPPEVAVPEVAELAVAAAGSGQAKYVLLDHYLTSSLRRLWIHADGAWRYRNVTNTEEQGVAQVAFASDNIQGSWDDKNVLWLLRCWKSF